MCNKIGQFSVVMVSLCLPSDASHNTYCLTWVSLTLDVGYLLMAAAPDLGCGVACVQINTFASSQNLRSTLLIPLMDDPFC